MILNVFQVFQVRRIVCLVIVKTLSICFEFWSGGYFTRDNVLQTLKHRHENCELLCECNIGRELAYNTLNTNIYNFKPLSV